MTPMQRTASSLLFIAVLILGGWAWSQESPEPSPSDEIAPMAPITSENVTKGDDLDTRQTDAPPLATGQTNVFVESEGAADEAENPRWQAMIFSLWIFVLAVFLGIELISKVPPTLHTPLMSGSNAISGITLVGAVIVAAAVVGNVSTTVGVFARFLGFIAVTLAMINAVGGFLVTHRMLSMFTRK